MNFPHIWYLRVCIRIYSWTVKRESLITCLRLNPCLIQWIFPKCIMHNDDKGILRWIDWYLGELYFCCYVIEVNSEKTFFDVWSMRCFIMLSRKWKDIEIGTRIESCHKINLKIFGCFTIHLILIATKFSNKAFFFNRCWWILIQVDFVWRCLKEDRIYVKDTLTIYRWIDIETLLLVYFAR